MQEEMFVDADAIFGEGERGLGVYRLPGSKSRYGQRDRWGPIQHAMKEIVGICHGLPPAHFNAVRLTVEVRTRLAKDPAYRAVGFTKEVSRPTVLRAVQMLLADNARP
jgi:hypothetical protein